MERLAIRNSDGSVSQPTDLRWAEALERLADYEDTNLMPEEFKSYWAFFEDLVEDQKASEALSAFNIRLQGRICGNAPSEGRRYSLDVERGFWYGAAVYS